MLCRSRLSLIAVKEMLSKAPSMSRKMPRAWLPAASESSIFLVILCIAESVEKFRLNPC